MHFEPCSSVLFSLVNLLLQCEQSNGFFSLCTPSCSFSSLFRSKLSWQCGQLNGFFPVCSLSCFIKSLSRLNPLSQFEQLNGLSPNVLSHWVKLNASISACLFSWSGVELSCSLFFSSPECVFECSCCAPKLSNLWLHEAQLYGFSTWILFQHVWYGGVWNLDLLGFESASFWFYLVICSRVEFFVINAQGFVPYHSRLKHVIFLLKWVVRQ